MFLIARWLYSDFDLGNFLFGQELIGEHNQCEFEGYGPYSVLETKPKTLDLYGYISSRIRSSNHSIPNSHKSVM